MKRPIDAATCSFMPYLCLHRPTKANFGWFFLGNRLISLKLCPIVRMVTIGLIWWSEMGFPGLGWPL